MVYCWDCVFWKQDSRSNMDHVGECRRHAPRTFRVKEDNTIYYEGHWPEAFSDWGCGDGVVDGERLHKRSMQEGKDAAIKELGRTTLAPESVS